MKNPFLILFLVVAIPSFAQRTIPFASIKAIEARMTDAESSLFLLDSLYNDYINVGPFKIEERVKSNSSDQGSAWLYNNYTALSEKYPKQCRECKTKADDLMRLINKEIQADLEKEYRKVIQKADDCFQQQDFPKAKEYYLRAVNFRPSDPYPKQRLEEIEAILAEQDKKNKQ